VLLERGSGVVVEQTERGKGGGTGRPGRSARWNKKKNGETEL